MNKFENDCENQALDAAGEVIRMGDALFGFDEKIMTKLEEDEKKSNWYDDVFEEELPKGDLFTKYQAPKVTEDVPKGDYYIYKNLKEVCDKYPGIFGIGTSKDGIIRIAFFVDDKFEKIIEIDVYHSTRSYTVYSNNNRQWYLFNWMITNVKEVLARVYECKKDDIKEYNKEMN